MLTIAAEKGAAATTIGSSGVHKDTFGNVSTRVAPQAAVERALARRQMPALEWELVLVVLMQLALVRVLLVLLLLVLGPVQAQLQLFDQARGQLVSQVQQL